MKTYIIPFHSFVDLITNSSTEIYVSASEGTVKALKSIIDNLLSVAGSDKKSDDLFVINVVNCLESDATDWKEVFVTQEEFKAGEKEDKWSEDDLQKNGEYGEVKGYLRITPKTDSPEASKLAKQLEDLSGIFSIDAAYNG